VVSVLNIGSRLSGDSVILTLVIHLLGGYFILPVVSVYSLF
jgi:hypothetical protein